MAYLTDSDGAYTLRVSSDVVAILDLVIGTLADNQGWEDEPLAHFHDELLRAIDDTRGSGGFLTCEQCDTLSTTTKQWVDGDTNATYLCETCHLGFWKQHHDEDHGAHDYND